MGIERVSLLTVMERADKFKISCAPHIGYICFRLHGFLAKDEGRACYSALNELWRAAHARHGRVLFLVDAKDAQVQAPALIAEMAGANPNPVCADDRLAFVVSSHLLKMQFQREVGSTKGEAAFFLTAVEAEAWLTKPVSPGTG